MHNAVGKLCRFTRDGTRILTNYAIDHKTTSVYHKLHWNEEVGVFIN